MDAFRSKYNEPVCGNCVSYRRYTTFGYCKITGDVQEKPHHCDVLMPEGEYETEYLDIK
jgi:hypothetical protein